MPSVIFDLDETLIDRSLAMRNFAEALWERYLCEGELSLASFVEQVFSLDQYGYAPRSEFFAAMWANFSKLIPNKEIIEEAFFAEVWRTPVLANGVIDCLSRLKAADIPLAIVTNGSSEAQSNKIEHSGLNGFFDVLVVSEELGVKKPDPSIYLEASARLGVLPANSWFVGDHPVNDVWGSKQVGCQSAWVHRNRPWASNLAPCYDVKGASFEAAMSLVLHDMKLDQLS